MFLNYSIAERKSVDFRNFDTSQVTDMEQTKKQPLHIAEKCAAISSGQPQGERNGRHHPATPRMWEQGEDAAADEVGIYE
jgi:hypothetical protein